MKKGKFLLGALIGAAAGVLLSPVTGTQARRAVAKKFNDLKIKVQDVNLKDIREEFEIKVEEIQDELASLDKEKAVKIAKEKVEIIKDKLEDLVDYAAKAGTPVLNEMALDVKKTTISLLKEVIKNLETKKEN